MMTLPRLFILSKVGEPATVTLVSTAAVVDGPPPVPLLGLPSLPHALSARPPTSSPTARLRTLIVFSSPCSFGYLTSMREDLTKEILRPVGLGRREELVRGGVLDNLTVGHEYHPVRGVAREAHLVGDDEHGHTVLGEVDHHVEHLLDHLGVERGG